MLAILCWLAGGAVVGLAVRALAPDRLYHGAFRAISLGMVGALIGGLIGTALLGSDDLTETPTLVAWLAAVIGGGVIAWLFVAYGLRWERPALGPSRPLH